MPANAIAIAQGDQTTLSECVRVTVKRLASANGGLKSLMAELGMPYKKAWEQLNRNQGVLVDILPAFAAAGMDEPLRKVAAACGYDVTPKVKFLRKQIDPARPVRAHALDIHHAAAALSMLLEDALADKEISAREREALKALAFEAKKKISALEARIESGSRA